MKIPTCIAAASLFTAILASTSAFAADANEAELNAAAVDLGHRYDASYAAKDPSAMAALYATDGVLVSPSGPIVRGRTELHDYYVKRFASGAQGHAITVKEVHVKGDGGYGIADFSVTVPDKKGALHKESGKIVAIYQHDADGWHLSLVQPSVPAGKHA
jgi:uncharacterized protein (TIGR02246 family)